MTRFVAESLANVLMASFMMPASCCINKNAYPAFQSRQLAQPWTIDKEPFDFFFFLPFPEMKYGQNSTGTRVPVIDIQSSLF